MNYDDLSESQDNRIGIYLIYRGADAKNANYIKSLLPKSDFRVIDYKEEKDGDGLQSYYDIAINQSHYALLLVSPNWNEGKISYPLQVELNRLMNAPTEKGIKQFVFAFVLGQPDNTTLKRIGSLCRYESVAQDNVIGLVETYVEHWKKIFQRDYGSANQTERQANRVLKPTAKLENIEAPIKTVYTAKVETFSPDMDISDLFWAYASEGFRHFPVTDKNGVLLGIVSLRDILKQEYPDQEIMDWIRDNYPDSMPKLIPPESISVGKIMTPHNDVSRLVTIGPSTTVINALYELYRTHDIGDSKKIRVSALPVVTDGDQLVGILSYSDILRKFPFETGLKVRDVMRPEHQGITTIQMDETLNKARRSMGDFRNLPVMNEKNHVVGMITDYELKKNLHPDYRRAKDAPVHLVMKRFLHMPKVNPDHDLSFVVKIFLSHKTLGGIAVTDDQDYLTGIITYIDIFRDVLKKAGVI